MGFVLVPVSNILCSCMFQMIPRGRMYRFPPGRNMPEAPFSGGMLSVPYDMGGMPMRDPAGGRAMPVPALASSLANATPEEQRTVSLSRLDCDDTEWNPVKKKKFHLTP